MKKLTALLIFLLVSSAFYAQVDKNYQKPPKEILDLVEAPPAPSVIIDDKGENVVLLYRDSYKSIQELSETEMRLGGLRINPKTNIGRNLCHHFRDKRTVKRSNDRHRAVLFEYTQSLHVLMCYVVQPSLCEVICNPLTGIRYIGGARYGSMIQVEFLYHMHI